jgi:hypothetical protein
MSRRFTALKPQLNRIRAWAHEGSTDAWIAHQLDTTADAVRAFRQENGIERGGPAPLAPITPDSIVEAMLAEVEGAAAAAADGALEAGTPEPEAAPAPEAPPPPDQAAENAPAPRRRTRKRAPASSADESKAVEGEAETAGGPEEVSATAAAPARKSRRGTRGGSSRSSSATPETQAEPPAAADGGEQATGEDDPGRSGTARKRGGRRRGRGRGRALEARLLPGSVLLLEPAVTADPVFQEHWGDAGPLRVEISADAIVLRRSAADAEPDRTAG